jgi:DNA topoisomerase I
VGAAAREVLEAVHRTRQPHGKSVSREEVAQARELGVDPASGKPMSVRMGRFGPFVQIGTKDDADKPRFAGLRPGQKMDAITHAEAIELFKLPRKLGAPPRRARRSRPMSAASAPT